MQFATLLPTAYNDGRKVPKREIKVILDEAVKLFGGYTLSEPMRGAWQDDAGKVYTDSSHKLTVVCDNSKLAEAEAFVLRAGVRLKQEAMLFEVRDFDGVRILNVTKPNA